ncbi:hypothetical protein BBK14_11375 [Parafrankia soli]|uniref:Helix-turn-helix domain-containing protein n=1 Tax=Parafrankia soli TaxID=2599596 RepID=A0A1S1RBR2_9ACTN|nr:helix-turn-helix domain-containing protein [Parafrankia soli]OHV42214.1 hypothetical protein BBK14_11375 [Parafrankia soli]
MSIEAITWVLNDAPGVPATLVSTLLGLANHAGPDGRNAYPKLATLARYTRKSERSVMWDLEHLVELGLIVEGEEKVVEHIPGGHRPGVYHLAMGRRRDPKKPEKATPRPARPKPKKKTSPVVDDTSSTPVVGDRSADSSPVADDRSSPELDDRSSPVVDDKSDLSSTTSALIRNEPSLNRPVEPSFEPSMACEHAETHTADDDGQTSLLPDEPPAAPPAPAPKPKRPRPTAAERTARATRMPEDYALTDKHRAYAIKKGVPAGAIEDMFEHFKAHHIGRGTRWESWEKAWITWVLNSRRFSSGSTTRRSGPDPNAGIYRRDPNDTTTEFTATVLSIDEWMKGA